MRNGPWPLGEAIVTGAGRLRASYVIHAAAIDVEFFTDADTIRNATRNALMRALELELSSIAFPALGAGAGGFPIEDVAEIMVGEVAAHAKGFTTLTRVLFALYDEYTYGVFERELGGLNSP